MNLQVSSFSSERLSFKQVAGGFLFALAMSASPAWAQRGGGSTGGGDAVACADKAGKKSVQFYDVYEATEIKGLKLDFGNPQWDYRKKLKFAIDKIAVINPSRAKRYQAQADLFEKEAYWATGKKLIDLSDEGIGFVPNNCEIQQLAIQNLAVYEGKRYLVNKDLFDAMSASQKAAFILHEVIYTEYGPGKTSVAVRAFNALIWSGELSRMNLKEYHDLLLTLGFRTFDDQNKIECGLFEGQEFSSGGKTLKWCSPQDVEELYKERSTVFLGQPVRFFTPNPSTLAKSQRGPIDELIRYDDKGHFDLPQSGALVTSIGGVANEVDLVTTAAVNPFKMTVPVGSLRELVSVTNPLKASVTYGKNSRNVMALSLSLFNGSAPVLTLDSRERGITASCKRFGLYSASERALQFVCEGDVTITKPNGKVVHEDILDFSERN